MKRIWLGLEQGFTVLALMLYSGGPLNVILSGGFSQGEREVAPSDFTLTRSLFLLTYGVFSLLLLLRWEKVLTVLRRDRTISVLVGLVMASVLWSDFPAISLKESIALIGTTLFGLYLATRYSPRQQLQLLGWTFAVIVGLSFMYAIAIPKYGIMGGVHAGAWRGIYTHKNALGQMMTLGSIVFLLLLLRDQTYRWAKALGLMSSFLLVILSTSKGSLLNFLAMFTAFCVCQIFRFDYRLLGIALIGIVIISSTLSLGIISNLETLVIDVLGKDLTFTGRTTLWTVVLEMIQQRPLLGYGYDAFWQGSESASLTVWLREGWPAPHSHNGFLDVALQLGWLGLGAFLMGFLVNMSVSLWRWRLTAYFEFVWPILFLVYLILANVGESWLMKGSHIFWVLYVAIAFSNMTPLESEADSPSSAIVEITQPLGRHS